MDHELFHNRQAGIYGKDFFFEAGRIILHLAKRNQVPALVALIDIDDFETLTASYDISIVDKIVESTTKLVIERCRSSDLVACTEEGKMGLLFYNITSVNAKNILDSIREKIATHTHSIGDEEKSITVSIGGTIMHGRTNAGEIDVLYEQAMMAVETVRKKGSNGAMVY